MKYKVTDITEGGWAGHNLAIVSESAFREFVVGSADWKDCSELAHIWNFVSLTNPLSYNVQSWSRPVYSTLGQAKLATIDVARG
jgi:hypothetical protein